jgi:hypothetical protein
MRAPKIPVATRDAERPRPEIASGSTTWRVGRRCDHCGAELAEDLVEST